MKWLPRKDSNLEREIQNLLCYHYTTRQCAVQEKAVTLIGPVSMPSEELLALSVFGTTISAR